VEFSVGISSPKAPAPVAPPPPPIGIAQNPIGAGAADMGKRLAANKTGMASTIATGGQGLAPYTGNTLKTLLGE
jgi:hypothetical protein